MNLLVLDQYSDPGGAQQQLLDLLPAFSARGWHVRVAMPGDGPMFARIRDLGIETERLSWRRPPRTPADLVYINGPRCLPPAALAGFPAPVVFHSHSFLSGWKSKLAGQALRQLRASVIASCRYVADPWRPYAHQITVIYNGVAPAPQAATLPHTPPHIACIGRISPEKGQLQFAAAAAAIHAALPACRFTIYGAPLFANAAASRYHTAVRAAAAHLPIEFAGWIEDIHTILPTLDLLLVPSTGHEATTRVILEAFAAGVPVIAFPTGGIPEVIRHDVDGLLASTAEEAARLAVALLSDFRRLRAISQAARESWERNFTLDRYRHDIACALEQAAR